jgi:tetratricopeptide (TPR) repeat protein
MKSFKIICILQIVCLSFLFTGCEDYLNKSPEASIGENDIFKSFYTFQGFVEEMYSCITDYNKAGAWNRYLFADETLNNIPYSEDQGNYWDQSFLFYNEGVGVNTGNVTRNKRIWHNAWYAIRKANLTLEKLDLLEGNEYEKNLLAGQAYYFRGWFHFELARWWGGLPYIDKVLASDDNLSLPRLSFQETAQLAAADFAKAAELLPVDWNEWSSHVSFSTTDNRNRISKVMALSYQGKALLYAGSPMPNEEAGKGNTFNADLCKQAADVFAAVLKICDETSVYKLHTWENWTSIFWVWSSGGSQPGGTEVIVTPTRYNDQMRWSTIGGTCPVQFELNASRVEVPTVNIVNTYAMANGLPIDDPESGYDPADPWSNREPRFYSDIIVDGDEIVEVDIPDANKAFNKYAELFTGGRHRGSSNGSVTGFYYKRYSPIGCNTWQGSKTNTLQAYIPYMRLADVYLMYAEATLHGYGLNGTANGYGLTPLEALEIIRSRAQLQPLPERLVGTKELLMEALIRERAIELAFEAARHHDLRRWNISGQDKYKRKLGLFFERGPDGKPVNIEERVIITRVFDKKHNWWPFQTKFTNLYPEFKQNPGW